MSRNRHRQTAAILVFIFAILLAAALLMWQYWSRDSFPEEDLRMVLPVE